MEIIYRILTFVILAVLAGPLFAFTVNVLIKIETIPSGELSSSLGEDVTMKAIYVWMWALLPATISLFIKQSWGRYLTALPLIAPSIFAVIYSMSL